MGPKKKKEAKQRYMAPSVPNFTLSLCGNFGEETQKRTQQRAMQCMSRMRTLTVLKHYFRGVSSPLCV